MYTIKKKPLEKDDFKRIAIYYRLVVKKINNDNYVCTKKLVKLIKIKENEFFCLFKNIYLSNI